MEVEAEGRWRSETDTAIEQAEYPLEGRSRSGNEIVVFISVCIEFLKKEDQRDIEIYILASLGTTVASCFGYLKPCGATRGDWSDIAFSISKQSL